MAADPATVLLHHARALAAAGHAAALTDGELLARLVGGHYPSVLEALVRRHGPMVLRVARGALADPHDADDVFQATFLALARRAPPFAKASRSGAGSTAPPTGWPSRRVPRRRGGGPSRGGRGRARPATRWRRCRRASWCR